MPRVRSKPLHRHRAFEAVSFEHCSSETCSFLTEPRNKCSGCSDALLNMFAPKYEHELRTRNIENNLYFKLKHVFNSIKEQI